MSLIVSYSGKLLHLYDVALCLPSAFKLYGACRCLRVSALRDSDFRRFHCLQNRYFKFIRSSKSAPFHSIKGWKIVAKTGQKNTASAIADRLNLTCEEGTQAVQHEVIMKSLQNCSTVQEQIQTLCSLTEISEEEIQNNRGLCESLRNAIVPYFPKFKVHQFGSSINGLGFKGCDVDISLQTCFPDDKVQDFEPVTGVPTLEDVLEKRVSPQAVQGMHSVYLMRFVRRILRGHCPNIKEPIFLIKARCPLLRFYDEKHDVFCDFSPSNEPSLQNTRLMIFLSHLDHRFVPLTKVIRYWGKHGGFVGDIDKFNSYSMSLLVLHFLQNTDPPVLPSISETVSKSSYLRGEKIIDEDTILQDIKNFQPSENNQSLDELLKEFFFYFLLYDFSRIIVPLTGSSIDKTDLKASDLKTGGFEFGSVCILDPFRPFFNSSAGAAFKSCRLFLHALTRACATCQSETPWMPDPASPWGLCSLFREPVDELETPKEWRSSLVHTIEIPMTSSRNASYQAVKDILQHGLLFKCAEFKTKNSHDSMKLKCQVFHNTWQGRNELHRESNFDSSLRYLENEHCISVELMKRKEEYRKQLLFLFQCDCSEVLNNNQVYLRMTLTFQESKFPPILALFLRDYLPNTLSKILKENYDVKALSGE